MDKVLAIGDNVLSIGGMLLKPIERLGPYGRCYIWWNEGSAYMQSTQQGGVDYYPDASYAPHTKTPVAVVGLENPSTTKVIVVVKDPTLVPNSGLKLGRGLEEIYLDVNLTNFTSLDGLFSNKAALRSLDLSRLNFTNIQIFQGMFAWCTNLEEIVVDSRQECNAPTYLTGLFAGCQNLPSNVIQNFVDNVLVDTSRVTHFNGMFNGCTSLTTLDLSKWDTSSGMYFDLMFYDIPNLDILDLSNFKVSSSSQGTIIRGCTPRVVYVDNCDTTTINRLKPIPYNYQNYTYTLTTYQGRNAWVRQ